MVSYQKIIDVIANFSTPTGVWVHEKIVCRELPRNDNETPREVLTKAMKYFKKGLIPIGDTGKKIAVNQGTLADNNIVMRNHGMKEKFTATAKLTTNKNSTTPQHIPRWLFYGNSPTSVQTQLKICKKLTTSCDEWENWCNRGPNVTRSCLDTIKNICSEFEIADDNTIRKMLFYSNFYSAPQITRSRSAPLAKTNAPKQNNTGSTKSTLPEPVELTTPSQTPTDPYLLEELKKLSWEDLATVESYLLEDGWEPKRLKWCRENIKIERAARLKNQQFRPKDDELLQDLLADSERYTKGGERLARII